MLLQHQYFKATFNRWFSDLIANAKLPDRIVDYRNLVHIHNELQSTTSTPDVCALAARELLLTLNNLLERLTDYAGR
jgi:hypothetical protein